MSTDQSQLPSEIVNTRVFDYQREVIVELHGRTTTGEFEVVSYVFTDDEGSRLEHPEIPSAHEDVIREALAETEYTLD